MKYYINGWEETKSYFFSFGFTEEEKKKLFNGEQVKKDNNIFWIEKKSPSGAFFSANGYILTA